MQLFCYEHLKKEGVFRRLAGKDVVYLLPKPTNHLRCGQQLIVAVYYVVCIYNHLLGAESAVEKVDEKKEKQIKAQKNQANLRGALKLLFKAEKIVYYFSESSSFEKGLTTSEMLSSYENGN